MELKPGYKRTEAGTVPEDWHIRPLASVAARIGVGIASAATHAYRAQGVPLFRNQNIKPGHLDDSDLLFVSPEYDFAFRSKRLRGGDLVTMRTGYPGVTAVVPQAYEGAQSFTTLITRPDPRQVDPNYLCYFINSQLGQRFFGQSQIGGAQKNVNAGTLRQMPVVVPTLPEQRAIAAALIDVDALLESLDRVVAKKRDLKQAAMQQLLTGQVRVPGFGTAQQATAASPDWVPPGYVRTELGVVPGDWKRGLLATALASLEAGASVNSDKSEPTNFDGSPCVLKTGAAHGGKVDPRESKKVVQRDLWRLKVALRKDTILISRMNTIGLIGESGYVDADYPNVFVPDRLWMAAVRPHIHPLWFSYLLTWQGVRSQISDAATGTSGSMKNISKESLRSVRIAYPSLPEQVAIAKVLTDMDAGIAALEARRSKTHDLKQAMMQELLTGRTRLVSPTGPPA